MSKVTATNINQLRKAVTGYTIKVYLYGSNSLIRSIWVKVSKKHLFDAIKGHPINATVEYGMGWDDGIAFISFR